jgi:hypothetical protein
MKQSQTLLAKALQTGCNPTTKMASTTNTITATLEVAKEEEDDEDDDKGFE